MKKVLLVLLAIVVVFALAAAGGYGYGWYRGNHIFIEDDVYPINAQSLDLREKDISFAYYDTLQAQLPECDILWMVPFQDGKSASNSHSLTVSTLTREDCEILLEYFPELNTLDATGVEDYPLLVELQGLLPECQVIYRVNLGGTDYALDTTALTLEVGQYTYDALMTNLAYLPAVTDITLRMPELTQPELDALQQTYPGIALRCTVDIQGQEHDANTTTLDLSTLTSAEVEEVARKLSLLPNLETVELMDSQNRCGLTMDEVTTLMDAAPEAAFHYVFEFYGQTISTDDKEVIFKNQDMSGAEAELRQMLDLMGSVERVVLDNCRLSDETLAQLREDYRHKTKVVWRVWFGEGGNCLTDAEVIKAVGGLVDDNCADLIYCEDVRFMDIGHNEYLDAVPFIAGMVNLEYVIISGSLVKDLTPLANCTKLKFLELAFCEQVEDISPLSNCKELQMLNISNTHVTDLTPLDDINLTNLIARLNPRGGSRVPSSQRQHFQQKHPDCYASFRGSQPYGIGWRYEEDNITSTETYALIRKVMRYDEKPIPDDTGYYLDGLLDEE